MTSESLYAPVTGAKVPKQVLLNTIWYHATTNEDWASDILRPVPHYLHEHEPHLGHVDSTLMVHIGSRDAALTRGWELVKEDPEVDFIWLFEVVLSPRAPMARKMFDDLNHWPTTAAGCGKSGHYSDFVVGINQYENTHEDAGSISLLVDARAIRVLNAEPLDAEAIKRGV